MTEYDAIMDYIIPLIAVVGLSFACAVLRKGKGIEFSLSTFICSMAIGLTALIWIGILPEYTIVMPILIISGMLFTSRNGSPSNE